MDTTIIEILKYIIPLIVTGVFSFAGIKIGLKTLETKVEENKTTLSTKIDKIDLKLEKISEQQIKADKELILVEHRVKKMEEQHDDFEESLKKFLGDFEKVKIKLAVKHQINVDE